MRLLCKHTVVTMKGLRAAVAFGLLCLTASLSPSDAQTTASSQVSFLISSFKCNSESVRVRKRPSGLASVHHSESAPLSRNSSPFLKSDYCRSDARVFAKTCTRQRCPQAPNLNGTFIPGNAQFGNAQYVFYVVDVGPRNAKTMLLLHGRAQLCSSDMDAAILAITQLLAAAQSIDRVMRDRLPGFLERVAQSSASLCVRRIPGYCARSAGLRAVEQASGQVSLLCMRSDSMRDILFCLWQLTVG